LTKAILNANWKLGASQLRRSQVEPPPPPFLLACRINTMRGPLSALEPRIQARLARSSGDPTPHITTVYKTFPTSFHDVEPTDLTDA